MAKNKTGYSVTFINTSTEVKKALEGLSKTALRASGKILRKKLRTSIPIKSRFFKNHIGTWVFIGRDTGIPQMQIGFYSWQRVKKKGKQPSATAPQWLELGVKPHDISIKNAKVLAYNDISYGKTVKHPGLPAHNFLRDTVYNNLEEIRAAQAEYLEEIQKTIDEAKQKIDQGEEFEDDD